jgi:hypothetical protein
MNESRKVGKKRDYLTFVSRNQLDSGKDSNKRKSLLRAEAKALGN